MLSAVRCSARIRLACAFRHSPAGRLWLPSQIPRLTLTRAHLATTPRLRTGSDEASETVNVIFKDTEGGRQVCQAAVGKNILDVALDNNLDLEGACGGTLACSTCHVIVDEKFYKMLPEPQDEELDMLDLAFGLQPTSRLGCQIVLNPELNNIEVILPDEVSDARKL